MRGILCDRYQLQLVRFSTSDAGKVATELKQVSQHRGQVLSWEEIEWSVAFYLQLKVW